MKEVIVVSPRGFCAGVDRAVKQCEEALEKYGKPVYLVHQLVHNDDVCRALEDKGAVFVDSLEEIPVGSVVVFSAHGSPPSAFDIARERSLWVVDATCPLVTRVHNEVKKYAKEGRTIVILGHPDHVEVAGTAGHALKAGARTVILNPDTFDTDFLKEGGASDEVAVVTQTTLSQDDVAPAVKEVKNLFPTAIIRDDICYATGNRQKAILELSQTCDAIIVVGSHLSSNSQRLREVADRDGCRAYLVADAAAVPWFWLTKAQRIGVTSGASTPEHLVEEVVKGLTEAGFRRRDQVVIEENIQFKDGVV